MSFVKVRYRKGPLHEFWISKEAAVNRPHKYEVIDGEERVSPGLVEYKFPAEKPVVAVKAEKASAHKPSLGDPTEEGEG